MTYSARKGNSHHAKLVLSLRRKKIKQNNEKRCLFEYKIREAIIFLSYHFIVAEAAARHR